MKIREATLLPLALQRIGEADGKKDLESSDFRDELAQELFQTHRGSSTTKFKSRVQERTWSEIPNSQKGRYRNMVIEALGKYQRQQKRKKKP